MKSPKYHNLISFQAMVERKKNALQQNIHFIQSDTYGKRSLLENTLNNNLLKINK